MVAAAAGLFWFGQGTSKVNGVTTAPANPFAAMRAGRTQDDALAMRYVRAYQSGDCDEITGLTAWMQERMRKAALTDPAEEALEKVRQELRARVLDRSVEGNRLSPEGVEDAQVFAPGTTARLVGSDKGRKDLSQPVQERAWVRVTYPARDTALCDESGRPIRSITVGVNVSSEGYVVKAGVVGNLDVDRSSISYDWNDNQGG
jgi:hypothetical protein